MATMIDVARLAGVSHGTVSNVLSGAKGVRIEKIKAVSQNLMHANIGITDGIYGRLPEDDIFELISGMTQ